MEPGSGMKKIDSLSVKWLKRASARTSENAPERAPALATRPRIALPSLVWLLLAVASFVAAVGVWQSQRLERMRPPAVVVPPLSPPPATSTAPGANGGGAGGEPAAGGAARALAAPVPPAGASPAVAAAQAAAESAASPPLRQIDPQAGRQVLRCVSKGRVTYRDLNAGCPDGASERVTVFPTEGVGKPQ
ncbi:MAG: hypothetical protein AD742_19890 [Methylibium sp. NZG]|nr:MAG: hypothetical protein AD742_19890 [Methylibium sp. NZG]